MHLDLVTCTVLKKSKEDIRFEKIALIHGPLRTRPETGFLTLFSKKGMSK
jgi:hypothetical protein